MPIGIYSFYTQQRCNRRFPFSIGDPHNLYIAPNMVHCPTNIVKEQISLVSASGCITIYII